MVRRATIRRAPPPKQRSKVFFASPPPAPAPILGILWQDVVASTSNQFGTSAGQVGETRLSRCVEWAAYHRKNRMARYDVKMALNRPGSNSSCPADHRWLVWQRSGVAEQFEALSWQYPSSNVEILASCVLDSDWLDPSSVCACWLCAIGPATDTAH